MKKKLNVLIPCAGKGSRFLEAGYDLPKPLIPVLGKPMIQWVLDSIECREYIKEIRYIFLVLKEHNDKFNIKENILHLIKPQKSGIEYGIYSDFIEVDKVTEGAACTSLLAKDLINNDDALMICNSDQYFKFHKPAFFTKIETQNKLDGVIFTFEANHLKWSYAEVDAGGIVKRVAEKIVISNEATVGCYWYRKGSDYVKYAEQMINKNIRTNNEFYICPVYNEFIEDGKIITAFPVNTMCGLGTPEDVKIFEQSH